MRLLGVFGLRASRRRRSSGSRSVSAMRSGEPSGESSAVNLATQVGVALRETGTRFGCCFRAATSSFVSERVSLVESASSPPAAVVVGATSTRGVPSGVRRVRGSWRRGVVELGCGLGSPLADRMSELFGARHRSCGHQAVGRSLSGQRMRAAVTLSKLSVRSRRSVAACQESLFGAAPW